MPGNLDAPGVVIAHGAWLNAAGWREVIALLQGKGVAVLAVQNPLSALADDVDAVTRAPNHQPGSVVLVGHGDGGSRRSRAPHAPIGIADIAWSSMFAPTGVLSRAAERGQEG